jgi:hypothetical protein
MPHSLLLPLAMILPKSQAPLRPLSFFSVSVPSSSTRTTETTVDAPDTEVPTGTLYDEDREPTETSYATLSIPQNSAMESTLTESTSTVSFETVTVTANSSIGNGQTTTPTMSLSTEWATSTGSSGSSSFGTTSVPSNSTETSGQSEDQTGTWTSSSDSWSSTISVPANGTGAGSEEGGAASTSTGSFAMWSPTTSVPKNSTGGGNKGGPISTSTASSATWSSSTTSAPTEAATSAPPSTKTSAPSSSTSSEAQPTDTPDPEPDSLGAVFDANGATAREKAQLSSKVQEVAAGISEDETDCKSKADDPCINSQEYLQSENYQQLLAKAKEQQDEAAKARKKGAEEIGKDCDGEDKDDEDCKDDHDSNLLAPILGSAIAVGVPASILGLLWETLDKSKNFVSLKPERIVRSFKIDGNQRLRKPRVG